MGAKVKVPAPSLVRLRRLGVGAENVPVKVVLVSSRPKVNVDAPVPEEFSTKPAPLSEPTIWPALLMSKVAPAATVSGLRFGRMLPA